MHPARLHRSQSDAQVRESISVYKNIIGVVPDCYFRGTTPTIGSIIGGGAPVKE